MQFSGHSSLPITQDLVLVGGGHSHALVLRKLGMRPLPEQVRLTLVTNLADTPYSGMLPCHIAGHYDFETAHIDLRPLTRFANCRLIFDEMIGLNTQRQQVICREHPPIAYDVLSIDTGSTPTKSQVPGAAERAIAAKPVPKLLQAWQAYLQSLTEQLTQDPRTTATLAIVGGGVGGVEMAFAMQVRLWQLFEAYTSTPRQQVRLHIFQRGPHLAKGRNGLTQRMVERLCRQRQIAVHTGESVCEVTAKGVRCESGLTIACDRTFWVTHAAPPPWLAHSDLSLDEAGFIAVADTLQTCSHPNIFAAGDVATMINHPRPKAGVFAVRQGPPLYENLKRQVSGQPLKPFRPQRRYLNIIDTDCDRAIASWGPFAIHARWCRRWKHQIDSRFMALFNEFPTEMAAVPRRADQSNGQILPPMHCAGCGSKVGATVLNRALKRALTQPQSLAQPILIGLEAPDDAAVIQVPPGKLAVQTVDYFRAIVEDPYRFGQIAVNHCLSDLFAMGATSSHVLALATIPYGSDAIQEETLYQLLSGALNALAADGTLLAGGHTTEGPELALGFACHGWIAPDQIWRKSGMEPGQVLILTKALGTGCLFAADGLRQAKGRWIEAAIAAMSQSNRAAAECLRAHGATACTDVTGFGLAGHLWEMAAASQVNVSLDLSQLPQLPGVAQVLEKGIVSSLHDRNQRSVASALIGEFGESQFQTAILFDPQTAGGLLASLPACQAEAACSALQALGYGQSRCIGQVLSPSDRPTLSCKPLAM